MLEAHNFVEPTALSAAGGRILPTFCQIPKRKTRGGTRVFKRIFGIWRGLDADYRDEFSQKIAKKSNIF